jgi:hypothetical protein
MSEALGSIPAPKKKKKRQKKKKNLSPKAENIGTDIENEEPLMFAAKIIKSDDLQYNLSIQISFSHHPCFFHELPSFASLNL